MAKALLPLGIVMALAGAGLFAYGKALRPAASNENTLDVARQVSELDSSLRAARATASARAKTMAEVDRVRNAIATDAVTAMDMVGRELQFKPDVGETLELVQTAPAKAPMSLLVLPAGSGWQLTAAGSQSELGQGEVRLIETMPVIPLDEMRAKEGIAGFVTVSRSVSLADFSARLQAIGFAGYIELNGKRSAFGNVPADARPTLQALPSEKELRLYVANTGTPAPTVPWFSIAGAALGLGVMLMGVAALKKRSGGVAVVPPSGTMLGQGPGLAPAKQVVGRWETIRLLGSGGMADVYLARARGEAGFEKLVALKIMHAHLARIQIAVDHFLDEARVAAQIHHPNVVSILDLGKIGDDYVIVMDYVEGADLEKLLQLTREHRRQIPIDIGLGILGRVCDGLHAAHQLGTIHRDVKVGNVLVSRQGGVKVVDFGIAKAVNQIHVTTGGEVKGTPAMMAPEQRTGSAIDVRADVYAVGVLGYEMLTGMPVDLDLAKLMHLDTANWPHLPPAQKIRAEIFPEVDSILFKAMSFLKEGRQTDASVLAHEFEQVMKKHNLSVSDKDIARWVQNELGPAPKPQALGTPSSPMPPA